MGKLLNVQKIIVGSLSKLFDNYVISINMVDVETSEIVASVNEHCVFAAQLPEAAQTVSKKLIKRERGGEISAEFKSAPETVKPVAKIININANEVAINAGKLKKNKRGDFLNQNKNRNSLLNHSRKSRPSPFSFTEK